MPLLLCFNDSKSVTYNRVLQVENVPSPPFHTFYLLSTNRRNWYKRDQKECGPFTSRMLRVF